MVTLSAEPALNFAPPSNELWFVLQTRPGAEAYASDFLSGRHRYGPPLQVYYPRVLTTVRHAGSVRHVPRPFLARLLFVAASSVPSIAFLRDAPGVSRFLPGDGGAPAIVRQRVIDDIREREGPDGFVILAAAQRPARYRRGQLLRLAIDYEDLDVVFQCYRGEHRAQVFINWLGRQVRTECSVASLKVPE